MCFVNGAFPFGPPALGPVTGGMEVLMPVQMQHHTSLHWLALHKTCRCAKWLRLRPAELLGGFMLCYASHMESAAFAGIC